MKKKYNFVEIEKKWQSYWEKAEIFRTLDPGDSGFDPAKPKFFVLDMFPYPSGSGLHVGHPVGYIATDIVARYKMMRGYNVLHPMGFDAFGLPAEQYAIETAIHPEITTKKNIETMRRQFKAFGLSYDWQREIATTDPSYYRWTQWIFVQLYESYFDPREKKALPIDLLQEKLADGCYLPGHNGELLVGRGESGSGRWGSLSPRARKKFIDRQRLAYISDREVNWCPALGTVLSNEEVTAEGRSERGNHPVLKRPMRQWMLKITAYADRLIEGLENLAWPEKVKAMQRNWIGRSEGVFVDFKISEGTETIRVFTTRADTLFGASYLALAPEHEIVDLITARQRLGKIDALRRRTRQERRGANEEGGLDGAFTGRWALNPVNDSLIPIWVADYVVLEYGTGAVMAVPAHDERDFLFAKKFGLDLLPVVTPPQSWLEEKVSSEAVDGESAGGKGDLLQSYLKGPGDFRSAFSGDGVVVNSSHRDLSLDGLETAEARTRVKDWLLARGKGKSSIQYKLRDWLFSRQRYWGEPIPILHDQQGGQRALKEEDLPLILPEMEDFSPPQGASAHDQPLPALSRAPLSWRVIETATGICSRELNTMPNWAGSCWYYLRFIDPKNERCLVDPAKERYWMGEDGVDLYVGGVEHAVLHLLYARFWHKVLYDLGHVSTQEPFKRLFNQGYVLAHSYRDSRGVLVPADEVKKEGDDYYYKGQRVERGLGKMGKSLKNAINPDQLFEMYGCDTVRLYEMYMGPLESSKAWNTRDIVGVHRFLHRIWRNFYGSQGDTPIVAEQSATGELRQRLAATIKSVTADLENLRFNTAIARLIELNNRLVAEEKIPREVAEPFVIMLSVFAPHVAEEIWSDLGKKDSVSLSSWPQYDEDLLQKKRLEIAIQINGKTRGTVTVGAELGAEELKEVAASTPRLSRYLSGKAVIRLVHVPGRLINIIVK